MLQSKKASDHGFAIYFVIALLASCLLALHYLIKGKAFAFYDYGSDTLLCYYPFQVAVAHQLHSLHQFTWSFELGLGGFIGALFDPVWLITGWLPDSWQLPLRLPMYLSHLIAGGGFLYGYLRLIGVRPLLCVIGGLGYAFSSYGTLNAQWDTLYDSDYLQLSAFLFFFEHSFRFGKRWAAIAAGVTVGLGPPLVVYMLGLFFVLYAGARLVAVPHGQRKDALRRVAAFIPWCVVGLVLTAPLLFPELYYLFENPRVSGEHSALQILLRQLPSLNDRSLIGWQVAGILGKDMLGTGVHYVGWQNYFEGPGFYAGLLPLLCLPQLFGRHATRAERILVIIGIVGCAMYFIWPALRYAVYGFGHMGFRFSTVWISLLLLVLGIAGLQRALLSGVWRGGILIGAAAIGLIVVGAAVLAPNTVNWEHAIRVLAFTVLYAALLLSASTSGGRPWTFEYLLIGVCACELLIFATPALIERDPINVDGSMPGGGGRYDDNTLQALAVLRSFDQKGDLFRVEKTYLSLFLNDSLVQRYAGTAQYSLNAGSITRFVDKLGLPRAVPHANYVSPMTPRPLVLDLVGVRYVLTRKRSLDGSTGMEYLASAGDVDIYRNNAAHSFGTFYDRIGPEAEADALPVPERDALLLTQVIVENPAAVDARLAELRASGTHRDVSRRADIALVRDDLLKGDVETPDASLLLLSMPFDIGWHAWLDDKDVDLFRADYGLTALLVPAGSHHLALSYSPPGRALGFSLMAGAIAFIVVFKLFSGAWGSRFQTASSLGRLYSWLRQRARRRTTVRQ
jgi:Bacterial membrane protein YfhO